MATVLTFKRPISATIRRLPVPAGGATIVIFPGVRYERMGPGGDNAPPRSTQERRRRAKR